VGREKAMSELRPVRLQGKAYWTALRAILADEGPSILRTLALWRAEGHKMTPALLGALAVRHRLNFKAMCEFLEGEGILPCGMYDRLKAGGCRPTQCLKAGEEWLRSTGL
jgi:hypothetical protein